MTSSGHAHSDCQHYDMVCHVTREQALNVTKKMGCRFHVWRVQPGGM